MSKDPNFIGQPVISQVLSFLPSSYRMIQIANKHQSDRYVKKFTSAQHLVVLLFAFFNRLTSLREIELSLAAFEYKLPHLGLEESIPRSTLADANARRGGGFFYAVFKEVARNYLSALSDSSHVKRSRIEAEKRIFAIDSTTIPLFSEIYMGNGCGNKNGQRKGGVKVHTVMDVGADIPILYTISDSRDSDAKYMSVLKEAPPGSIILMDKGYYNHSIWEIMSEKKVTYITRPKTNTKFSKTGDLPLEEGDQRVLADETGRVRLWQERTTKGNEKWHVLRRVTIFDEQKKVYYSYLTNNLSLQPAQIHQLYKQRWEIETLFKRLKQNFTLHSFLGNNRNAIKIQIHCALIALLLASFVRLSLKRSHSFSAIVTAINVSSMSYINIFALLEEPTYAKKQKKTIAYLKQKAPPSLFD